MRGPDFGAVRKRFFPVKFFDNLNSFGVREMFRKNGETGTQRAAALFDLDEGLGDVVPGHQKIDFLAVFVFQVMEGHVFAIAIHTEMNRFQQDAGVAPNLADSEKVKIVSE